jgi:two-component system, chemotaxis family, protein-glutamate methylesterase/glutaminase
MAADAGGSPGDWTGGFPVIAVAASAGGLRALECVLGELPPGFPGAIMVVLHLDRRHPSILAQLLARHTVLRVGEARDGDRLEPGVIYVAPPDRHLVVGADERIALTRGELVHYVRPAADALFESAALAFGGRAIAVVLSGTGVDGARGVSTVKRGGGTVIAQDETSSEFFAMPGAAIRTGDVDFILPLGQIGAKLISLTTAPTEPS